MGTTRRKVVLLGATAMAIGAGGALFGTGRAGGAPCDTTFVGPSGGSWNVPGNWDFGVPGATDAACASVDVVVDSGPADVLTFTSTGSLTTSGGTLHTHSTTEASSIAGLNGGFGARFDGPVDLSGASAYAGELEGVGPITVVAGGSLDLLRDGLGDSSNAIATNLVNEGSVTITGNDPIFRFYDATSLVNNASMTVDGPDTLRWSSPVLPNPEPSIVTGVDGTTDVVGAVEVNMTFENDGLVTYDDLELAWDSDPVADSGEYSSDTAGPLVVIGTRTFEGDTPLSGGGLLTAGSAFNDGDIGFTENPDVGRIYLRRGSLNLDVTVSDELTLGEAGQFTPQVVLSGDGATTVASTATLIQAAGKARIESGHQLVLQSDVELEAIEVCDTGSELVNEAGLTLTGTDPAADCGFGSDPGTVVNTAAGTLTVDGLDASLHANLDNAGTISVTDGSLTARGGAHTGTIEIANTDDVVDLGGGVVPAAFTGTAGITGDGLFVARYVTWSSSASLDRVRVHSLTGTVTVDAELDLEGELVGPGTITVGSAATATLDSTSASLTISGAAELVNEGTIDQSVAVDICGGTITNEGQWNAQSTVQCTTGGVVTNAATGTIALTDNWTVEPPFTNDGVLDTAGATAIVSGGGDSAGGSLSGTGSVVVNHGTFALGSVTYDGSIFADTDGTVTSTGSTVAGLVVAGRAEGTFEVTVELIPDGGTLGGSGSTTLADGASLSFGSSFAPLSVEGSHVLVIEGDAALDSADLFPDAILLCDSAGVSIEGSLLIGTGAIAACPAATGSVDVTATGSLHVEPSSSFLGLDTVAVPVDNDGEIVIDPGTDAGFDDLDNSGTFFDLGSGQLTVGSVTNSGTIGLGSADASFAGLTNASGTTLTGGAYDIQGPLEIAGLPNILTLSADLTIGNAGTLTDDLGNDRFKVRAVTSTGRLVLDSRNHATPIFSNAGRVEILGSFLSVPSGYFQTAGSTFLDLGAITKSQILGGRVEGSGYLGSVVRVTGGTLAPGDPSDPYPYGELDAGVLTFTAASTVEIELEPSLCGCSFSDLVAADTVSLAGTLALDGEGNAGESVAVVTAATAQTGTFGTVTGTFVPPATTLVVSYGPLSVDVFSAPPPTITASGSTVYEGTGPSPTLAPVTVSLSWASPTTITVDLDSVGGTAGADDFTAVDETVTFLPGETTHQVDVEVEADARFEPDETIDVQLSNVVGIATIDGADAVIDILDDDDLTPNVTTDAVDVAPGDGSCETAVTGECSLRAAVMEANALPGAQTLVLQPGTTYTLSIAGRGEDASATGDLDITDDITVEGNSAVIDADGIDRVVDVWATTVVLRNVVVTGGSATTASGDNGSGAGVLVRAGSSPLVLDGLTADDNTATALGGGIATLRSMYGTATLTDNQASGGGGLYVGAAVEVELISATVSGNTAGIYGGGILATTAASVTDQGSTVSGNQAAVGGGIAVLSGPTLTLENTTVQDNDAGDGGGIFVQNAASATLTAVGIVDNTAVNGGGGAMVLYTPTEIEGSLFWGNSATAGGGLAAGYETVTVARSTFTGNHSAVFGGAIVAGADLVVENSTITGNSTGGLGAGIVNYFDTGLGVAGEATIHSVTFGANAGDAILTFPGAVTTVTNSIVAAQTGGGQACRGGAIVSGGYNVFGDATCGTAGVDDIIGDVELSPLVGGLTPVQFPTWYAIDTGGSCLPIDQMGNTRDPDACDRGAVEQ